ncbi:MAG: bifunctional phosphoribosylaminoimidazolecarboxamide formyltransferase/inosine monophosphate cyclohydrolase [Armatimonadota bacterium]
MKPFALLSVTDKRGIVEFAKGLVERGYEILSTGGTGKMLAAFDVDYTGVSYYTGTPEILGGRVKTLHPKVHGGILARHAEPEDQAVMEELNIRAIRVVAVNLYPFEETVLSGASRDEVIENIDIGGPAMIRAAAKNAANVLVVVDPDDYDAVLQFIDGGERGDLRERLRTKAFAHTAFYDSLIAEYFAGEGVLEADALGMAVRRVSTLRYGENPHQRAALYAHPLRLEGIAHAEQVWGTELSFNNLLDADAAWCLVDNMRLLHEASHACAIIKHGNPCGAAWGRDNAEAFVLAREADPISAFGGIVALSHRVERKDAEALTGKGNFLEVVIAPDWDDGALEVFHLREGWGERVRLLKALFPKREGALAIRSISGGLLVQTADVEDGVEWRVVTQRQPTDVEVACMRNAWAIVKHVRSNGIVLADTHGLRGVGAGQMNRVQSVRLALDQAGVAAAECALASDGFFPFPDSIEEAARRGVQAVIQPGGSKKDRVVIAAADRLGLAMVLTGVRHFRH